MKDNNDKVEMVIDNVVNCFQKLLSSWWRTTQDNTTISIAKLWIAFKNYYLRDEGQQGRGCVVGAHSCELLSKIIIFVMKDNLTGFSIRRKIVVNCFQKLLSSWWRTTSNIPLPITKQLWIAFKNYYLRDEGQPVGQFFILRNSCELLSKIIIFVMKDNWSL